MPQNTFGWRWLPVEDFCTPPPSYNGTRKTFNWLIMWKILSLLGLKVFNSDDSYMLFCNIEMQFSRETTIENNHIYKHWYLIHTWSHNFDLFLHNLLFRHLDVWNALLQLQPLQLQLQQLLLQLEHLQLLLQLHQLLLLLNLLLQKLLLQKLVRFAKHLLPLKIQFLAFFFSAGLSRVSSKMKNSCMQFRHFVRKFCIPLQICIICASLFKKKFAEIPLKSGAHCTSKYSNCAESLEKRAPWISSSSIFIYIYIWLKLPLSCPWAVSETPATTIYLSIFIFLYLSIFICIYLYLSIFIYIYLYLSIYIYTYL